MLTAFLGSMYLVCKILRVKRNDKAFYKTMSRMTYGVLCFGVFFSLIGTILGGIWANMSWGRFWGWDPKENGALLIVLSQVAILHGRMGGFLREHGTCAMAALGGIVIAFSWFGTNLLSVGLHSYGFTDGINGALWTYYLIQGSIVLLSTVPWLLDRRAAAAGMAEAKVSMPDAPAKRATKALDQPAFGK
jgi:cytochrome c biogenesis factor